MKNLFNRFVREEAGQDLIEYVLLGSLIAAVCVLGVGALGTAINGWYDSAASWVDDQSAAAF